jgi:hypothetical protein
MHPGSAQRFSRGGNHSPRFDLVSVQLLSLPSSDTPANRPWVRDHERISDRGGSEFQRGWA